mmetsp:Transcript_15871/g.36600  ORF Transcript_15871/g.36600 Transcript_15871/m.36600 type:complete len:84 (+) Transcript_15871:1398-1649(+)
MCLRREMVICFYHTYSGRTMKTNNSGFPLNPSSSQSRYTYEYRFHRVTSNELQELKKQEPVKENCANALTIYSPWSISTHNQK